MIEEKLLARPIERRPNFASIEINMDLIAEQQMKTFKIQPRNGSAAEGRDSVQRTGRLKERTGCRPKNRSLVENPNVQNLYKIRAQASEMSARLDNEMFRVRSECDLQKKDTEIVFQELTNRLARKLNYLKNFAESQVSSILSILNDEKKRLDIAITELDAFLDLNSEGVTCRDVLSVSQNLYTDPASLSSTLFMPQVVDRDALFDTFNALLDGHVCRKDLKVDMKKVEVGPEVTMGLTRLNSTLQDKILRALPDVLNRPSLEISK